MNSMKSEINSILLQKRGREKKIKVIFSSRGIELDTPDNMSDKVIKRFRMEVGIIDRVFQEKTKEFKRIGIRGEQ